MSTAPNAGPTVLARQVRHELVSLLRQPLTMILSVGFPLVFFVLLSTLIGNAVVDESTGVRLVQFLAPALASFGVIMATFSFLASGLSDARATGVLKRQTGTPLPRWALIGGRIGAAVILGLLSVSLILVVGVVAYDLQLFGRSFATVVVTLLVSSFTFAALGIALALLLSRPPIVIAVTNGIAIVLAFISGVFIVSGTTPAWMDSVAWVFPLKHLVTVFSDALDPYSTGSGLQWDHLAVIALWGVAGSAVALWALRSGRERSAAPRLAAHPRARAADAQPRRSARPPLASLLAGQVAHARAILWRDASSVFFAMAFPLLLVAIIPTVNGGGDLDLGGGLLLGSFFAATMAVYGSAVTSFVNMPQGLAEERERGVLKRTRGTPLPTGVVLAGRVVAALAVSLLTLAGIVVLAGLMYSPPVPPGWPTGLLVFVLSTATFAIVGLGVVSLVHGAQAVLAATLGTLLPLCFISDVFVAGVDLPDALEAVSWVFPLRHAARAMTESVSSVASPFPWDHIAVILAWAALGVIVIAARFRSEAVQDSPPRTRRHDARRP
ncbi:MAG: ABC transporter permease [Dermatophilaceae bacterium]